MSQGLGTDYTRVNPLQSSYHPCIKSPCKVSSIVLGIVFIIAGAVAAGVLYSRLGNVSLSCLSGVAIGIALIILGARSTTNKRFEPVVYVEEDPTDEIHTLSITPYNNRIEFTNETDLEAGIYTIDRPNGDNAAILIGEMNAEKKLGPSAPTILCFEAEEKGENPYHKTMENARNDLGTPIGVHMFMGKDEVIKVQFMYPSKAFTYVTWNLSGSQTHDESGQKFIVLKNPALEDSSFNYVERA